MRHWELVPVFGVQIPVHLARYLRCVHGLVQQDIQYIVEAPLVMFFQFGDTAIAIRNHLAMGRQSQVNRQGFDFGQAV